MHIVLGDVDYDVTLTPKSEAGRILSEPAIAGFESQTVYRWTCPGGPGLRSGALNQDGAALLLNHIRFHETDFGIGFGARDKARSSAMQRSVLRESGADRLDDLRRELDRALRVTSKSLPLDAFSWMNTAASYLIQMRIEYAVFTAEAVRPKVGQDDVRLRFFILTPHRVRFTAEILDYCAPAAYEELIGEGSPHAEDRVEEFLVPDLSDRNREFRRAHVRREIAELDARLQDPEPFSPSSSEDRAHLLILKDRAEADLAALSR